MAFLKLNSWKKNIDVSLTKDNKGMHEHKKIINGKITKKNQICYR